MNAYVVGKVNYMMPLYNIANLHLKNKLHKIIMSAARTAIGNYCFMKSTIYTKQM